MTHCGANVSIVPFQLFALIEAPGRKKHAFTWANRLC